MARFVAEDKYIIQQNKDLLRGVNLIDLQHPTHSCSCIMETFYFMDLTMFGTLMMSFSISL